MILWRRYPSKRGYRSAWISPARIPRPPSASNKRDAYGGAKKAAGWRTALSIVAGGHAGVVLADAVLVDDAVVVGVVVAVVVVEAVDRAVDAMMLAIGDGVKETTEESAESRCTTY